MQEQTQSVDQRALRIAVPLALWTLAWAVSLALATAGPKMLWDYQPVLTWLGIAVNLAVGVGLILAHARYLKRLDELQRKVQLEAMAVALGVGFVGGCAYAAANGVGVIAFDLNFAFIMAFMAVVYAVGSVVGSVRYR